MRLGQGFAHLDQHSLPCRRIHGREDEIDLTTGPGLVIVYFRMQTAKRREDEVLQEMPGVDQNSRRYRGDQCMIDAVDLFRVDVAAHQRRIEYPHGKQEIGVLEPFQIVSYNSVRLRTCIWCRFSSTNPVIISRNLTTQQIKRQPVG